MRDRPFFAHKPIAVPQSLYPLHCSRCQKLTGMLVQPPDGEWRSVECSHCRQMIRWRIAPGDLCITEKSSTDTEGRKLYFTGSPL